ncbi:MAG: MBL fold metallo-hydrolase [candidate division WOR-3 bacterium]
MREIEFKINKIDNKFEILGNAYAYIYHFNVKDLSILIDTGTAFYGYKLRDYLKERGIKKIDYLLLTHSHYDHIGGVPILIESFDVKRIFAHSYIRNVFKSQRAINLINKLNLLELRILDPGLKYEFKTFEITDEVKENLTLDFEDIKIQFFETPGHTKDSVSYYVLPYKILILGESAGVPNRDNTYILPQFLSSIEDYLNSISKIMKLEIEILGLPHEHIIFGKENVKSYLEHSLKTTYEYIEIIQSAIIEQKSLEKILDYLTQEIHQKKRISQPIHAFRENLKAQIIAVARSKNLTLY